MRTRSNPAHHTLKLTTLGLLLMQAGCATQPEIIRVGDESGFFLGLFHGFTIFFAFIASFFTDYAVYAFPNTGWPYNLGFLIGVSLSFGGAGAASR